MLVLSGDNFPLNDRSEKVVTSKWVGDNIKFVEDAKIATGFIDHTTTTLSKSSTAVALQFNSNTTLYQKGTAHKFNAGIILTLDASSLSGGAYYIKLDTATRKLEAFAGNPNFDEDVLISWIYKNETDGIIWCNDERHLASRNIEWHRLHHQETGATWLSGGSVGFALQDDAKVSLDINTPLRITDEELYFTIEHSATPGYFKQKLEKAELPILYVDANGQYKSTSTSNEDCPFLYNQTRAVYNDTAAGTLETAPNGSYICYWLLYTTDFTQPVKMVLGTQAHNDIVDAEAESFENLGLNMPELVGVARIIVQTDDQLLNNIAKVQIAKVQYLKNETGTLNSALSPTNHNNLGGRNDPGQHPISAIVGLEQALNTLGDFTAVPLAKVDTYTPCFVKTGANTLSVKAGTFIKTPTNVVNYETDTAVTMPVLEPGEDYAIFVSSDGTVQALHDPFETPAVAPSNSILIGGFHYSETDAATTVSSGEFATSGAGMIWTQGDVDKIRGINAFSIWDLRFRAETLVNIPGSPRHGKPSNHGLAFDPQTKRFIGIYLCNTDTDTYGLSRSGVTVASGTVVAKVPKAFGGDGTAVYQTRGGLTGPGNWWDLQEVLASQGAEHPSEMEFNSFAFGTTEKTVLGGASVTIPLTKREPKFTSKIGIEQVTGHHWIWSRDNGASTTGTWTENNGGRGQQNTSCIKGFLGGTRDSDAAYVGSRCVTWSNVSEYSSWIIGCRASVTSLIF